MRIRETENSNTVFGTEKIEKIGWHRWKAIGEESEANEIDDNQSAPMKCSLISFIQYICEFLSVSLKLSTIFGQMLRSIHIANCVFGPEC